MLHPKTRRCGLEMQSHELAGTEAVVREVDDVILLSSERVAAKRAKRSVKYCWTSSGGCWLICSCRVVPTVYGVGPFRGDIC